MNAAAQDPGLPPAWQEMLLPIGIGLGALTIAALIHILVVRKKLNLTGMSLIATVFMVVILPLFGPLMWFLMNLGIHRRNIAIRKWKEEQL